MNKSAYTAEIQRPLNDEHFYKRHENDPTERFKEIVSNSISDLVKDDKISEKAIRSLIPLSPIPGRFYILRKIHKANNPGRPIVSAIGTITEPLSSFVDNLTKDVPPTFKSCLKDTNHFLLNIINLGVSSGSLLVALDVASLYTNIPHMDGIQAVLQAYEDKVSNKTEDSTTLALLLERIVT